MLRALISVIVPFGVIFLSFLIGLYVRKRIISKLSQASLRTKTKLDDVLISSLKGTVLIWFLLGGVFLALQFIELPAKVSELSQKGLIALLIFSAFWFLGKFSADLILAYSEKLKQTLPAVTIFKNLTRIFIILIGVLIILQTLGVSITPVLTTLGIGGLAVALALQDTLANLFSGLHIVATKKIRVGDYIKLDTGEEGYVVDITWRNTIVRQLPNNLIIIPNSKLSQSVVTNFYLPQKVLSVLVDVGVSYDSDLEKVERVTLEVAEGVMREVEGGVPEFKPFMRYHTFGDFSINFTVILRAKEFVDQFKIKHEFIKRLKKRYDEEGIVIPFPIRTVYMKKEEV